MSYYLGTFDNGNTSEQAVYASKHRRNSADNVADANKAWTRYHGISSGYYTLTNSVYLAKDVEAAAQKTDDVVKWYV